MTAIILAAGYGTRLYPLTLNKPKALLEVGGKTILDRLFENVGRVGKCKNAVIVTNEKFHESFEKWAAAHKHPLNIEVINDGTLSNATRLGAIGDINLVLEKEAVKEDILITGSDNLFDLELADFADFGEKKRPFSSVALFDVKDKTLARKYGIANLGADLRVMDFEEKPASPKSTLAAMALYFIPKEKIPKVREYMKTGLSKDAPGNLMKWLAGEDKVYGYAFSGTWYDIGDKESLKKADEEFTGR